MSDPNSPSGANDPYGQPGGSNPYGQPSPYGQPYSSGGYGSSQADAPTDGVSIASLVLSLLCCTGLIGLILGLVGLSRTKNGQRKGRWAAVTGIVVGALAVVASIGLGLIIAFAAGNSVTPDNAEVGQCINVREDGDTVYLTKRDCGDGHDGEIVHVGEYQDIEAVGAGTLVPDDINDLSDAGISRKVCSALMDEDDLESVDDPDLTWGLALEDPDDPADTDPFICYVEGDDLTGSLL